MKSVFLSKWIMAREFINPDVKIQNFYMKVKKSFVINKRLKASIKITADDYYKLYINGKFVGQGPAPGYSFAYNYNEYDISRFLQNGENIIEAVVYYQGLINRVFVSGDNRQGMIADVYFEDKYAFGTDSTWSYCVDNSFISKRTVGYNTAFLEDRDFRISESEYKSCVAVKPDYIFCNEPFPPLQIYSVKVLPIKHSNRYFYDFKQEYAANLKIKAHSKNAGAKIIIHCAEELDENNSPRYIMRCGCTYEETCFLNEGENLIEQFDYKSIRFAEIIADDGVDVNDVELMVRHYPFHDNSASLKSDDEILNAVFNLCKNTIKYGVQEVFIDCPSREKGQYIGDAFISGFAHLILTKDNRMLKKAIENAAQSIEYSGKILAVSPCALKQEIADYSLLFPNMLWKYYTYTKDKEFLLKMFPACEFINNYFAGFADSDGLLNKVDGQWNLVDWPDNFRDGYDFDLSEPIGSGRHNVINAFYISCVESEEHIKKELNIPFISKSDLLKKNYNKLFFNKKTCLYTDSEFTEHSSVHSNMLPVCFEICPDEYKDNVADFLSSKGMRCGTYMSYFYLKALCKSGRHQQAYNAITSKSENSWYNMIREGATTCFEAWGKDRKWNTSLFHPWSTTPIIILSEDFKLI